MERERLTLREWRRRKALTQEDLARVAQVTQFTVSQFEIGKGLPRVTTIRKLAQALGIEPDQLVYEQTQPRSKPVQRLAEAPEKQSRRAA